MSVYSDIFRKVLKEDGAGYIPSNPNTAGNGGALGDAASIGAPGYASGTPGTDTYATGDFRNPFGMGVRRRRKPKKRKKKK